MSHGMCFLAMCFLGAVCASAAEHAVKEPKAVDQISLISNWNGWTSKQGEGSQQIGGIAEGQTLEFAYDQPQDWRPMQCVEFSARGSANKAMQLTLTVEFDYTDHYNTTKSEIVVFPTEARCQSMIPGGSWCRVRIPIDQFQTERVQPGMWRYVKRLKLKAESAAAAGDAGVLIRGIRVTRPSPITIDCDRTSLPATAGETVRYELRIRNESSRPQTIALSLQHDEKSIMPATLSPLVLELAPGTDGPCFVSVTVPDAIPVGGQHTQQLVAVPNGDGERAATAGLTTVRRRPHPYMLVTESGWRDVQAKLTKYPWARLAADNVIKRAKEWPVPPFSDHERKVLSDWGPSLGLVDAAVAWKLTGDGQFRDKILRVCRQMLDPQKGYLARGNAVSADGIGVHEGMFFTYFCIAYDAVYDCPELTAEDHAGLERILVSYLDKSSELLDGRLVYNYSAGANWGGIMAALMLQDINRLNRQLYGRGGLAFQFSSGIMNDGWYQEGATNYHVLVLRYYATALAACANWGIDLYDTRFPTNYQKLNHQGSAFQGYLGMNFEKWGPIGRPYRSFIDMLDGSLPFLDNHGVLVAFNDSRPIIMRDVYEQVYARDPDPKYAWVIHTSDRVGYESAEDLASTSWRHLLFGVGEVPDAPDPRGGSVYALNVGLATLRSQTLGRSPDEQIAATLKWGTHGGWHGHFDRISLVGMQRYGVEFYSPLAGFHTYMTDQYKMWDQASASHNMVIVDELMQEPVESDMLLFHAGEMFQAAAAQTRARWYQVPDWMKFYPLKYGPHLFDTGVHYDPNFTPVLQRRVLVVTDDYVVMADFLSSDQDHTYDNLIHGNGLGEIAAVSKEFNTHADFADEDRVSSYHYMTDCDWYEITGPVLSHFQQDILKTDVYTLWPRDFQLMVGTVPLADARPDSPPRRVVLARSRGREARFLTILEPHRDQPLIRSAEASAPDRLRVELTDGRIQTIELENFTGDGLAIQIHMTESRDGKIVREERSIAAHGIR